MQRALAGLVIAFLVAVFAAHYAYTATTHQKRAPGNEPWAVDRMNFVAWNGNLWTAWIHENEFVHVPEMAPDRSRHVNRSIAYLDWQGDPWQAKIDGDGFLLAHRGDWQGDVERSAAIRYRDWSGRRQLRTLTQLRR